ncbi:ComEC/Rec2 family competence protein [Corynebacterium ureicelerivorans]|uniref:ComEC/Rec2 family competence protein n=1 Tax=Corynebacterium ureicelerivorans TaxID=401472 RepID=UPI002652396C|nr:ComEC/Rec2 family competence protein [Corynebacterium ureicelerivorans]MDN8605190.1 ComEC/Rec2 family competence protein [Corynebacterium ureicelerivorans]
MSELRLVPAALAVWAAAACCILFGAWAAAAVIAVLAVGCVLLRQPGQALLTAGLGAAATVTAAVRKGMSAAASEVVGTISGAPKQTSSGAFLVRVRVPGRPSTTPVFTQELPSGAVNGAHVVARGVAKESSVPGVNPFVLNGRVEVLGPPEGLAAFALHVRSTFAAAVEAKVGPASQGLIPGMVLGDVSLQSPAEQQMYIDTGLSHLSAVSGANIAIVSTAAAVVAAAAGAGLRGKIAASAAALLVYAGLVGPEPSVLRASVSGLVGLVAVLSSRQSEPIHALCLSVIGLVLADSDLAVHYGFALSVAATAGIVAVYPLLYQAFAATRWPDILVRALAVAVAADVATMPIVAMMAGEVSLVSVGANVVVAPVVGPVTVLGLSAAVLSLVPGGLETPVLWCVEPMARWVHTVARSGAGIPGATVAATPLVALVVYGWVVAGVLVGRPRVTLCVTVACVAMFAAPAQPASIDPAGKRAHVVDTVEEVEPVPAGAELVVVLEDGPARTRPVATREGIPVIFPNREP